MWPPGDPGRALPARSEKDHVLPFRFVGLLRMKRWAANPPSETMVKLVLGIIVVCVLVYVIEWLVGWPDWLTPHYVPRGRI